MRAHRCHFLSVSALELCSSTSSELGCVARGFVSCSVPCFLFSPSVSQLVVCTMDYAWLIYPNINKWDKNCHWRRVTSVFYYKERSIMTFRKDRTNADRSENSNRKIQIHSDQEWPTTSFVLTGFGVLLLCVCVCYLQWVDWPIVITDFVWIPCNLKLTWLNTQPFTCSEIYTEDVGISESSLPLSCFTTAYHCLTL
jgi:hypothetical protein